MDMLKVKEINDEYISKTKEENYENEHAIDVAIVSSEVLLYHTMIGSEADKLTFGECTRRFENNMRKLEKLMEGL